MTEPRMTEPSGGGALLDVNVLVALVLDQHVHHVAAHRQFAGVAERWFTTPLTEAGLLRLLLTPAVAGREVAGAEALEVLRGLHAQSGWSYLTDDASLAAPAIEASVLAGRKQVTDLHLVNLAAAHEATLVTFDARILPLLAPKDRGHVRVWDA